MSTQTRDQIVEEVRAAIEEQFQPWVEPGYGPRIFASEFGPAIVWEDGSPYGWVFLCPGGGVEEEFGFTVPAMREVQGVEMLEPLNNCALVIYFTDEETQWNS